MFPSAGGVISAERPGDPSFSFWSSFVGGLSTAFQIQIFVLDWHGCGEVLRTGFLGHLRNCS